MGFGFGPRVQCREVYYPRQSELSSCLPRQGSTLSDDTIEFSRPEAFHPLGRCATVSPLPGTAWKEDVDIQSMSWHPHYLQVGKVGTYLVAMLPCSPVFHSTTHPPKYTHIPPHHTTTRHHRSTAGIEPRIISHKSTFPWLDRLIF